MSKEDDLAVSNEENARISWNEPPFTEKERAVPSVTQPVALGIAQKKGLVFGRLKEPLAALVVCIEVRMSSRGSPELIVGHEIVTANGRFRLIRNGVPGPCEGDGEKRRASG